LASPAAAERTLLRAQLVGSLAYFTGMVCDLPSTQAAWEESAALFSEMGDMYNFVQSEVAWGSILVAKGEYEHGLSHIEKGLTTARAVGDRWQTAFALKALGDYAMAQGEFERAKEAYEEAQDLYRTQPLHLGGRVMTLIALARLALLQGEHDRAE